MQGNNCDSLMKVKGAKRRDKVLEDKVITTIKLPNRNDITYQFCRAIVGMDKMDYAKMDYATLFGPKGLWT